MSGLPLSVEDKLKKFQLVCEDKLRKIDLLQKQFDANEDVLRGFNNDHHMQKDIAKINLQLAQTQFDIAEVKEKKILEEARHQTIQDETKQMREELEEASEALAIMMQDIAQMKARMLQRVGTLTDYVAMHRENYLMTLEENRTISSLVGNATQRTQADQRIEWLEKLISATRIQHLEAERRLAAMNASRIV
eukprot:gene27135-30675_t